ncbi:MAG: hypothetical protein ACHQEB_04375 [Chitinophagales bacterium]
MQKYELVLKNEKEKTYTLISWLLLFANFISLVFLTIASDFKKINFLILGCAGVLIIFLLWYLKPPNEKLSFSAPFFIYSLGWLNKDYWWPFIANSLFAILEMVTRRKLFVSIYTDKIIYPALFRKTIQWSDISNVILKDGLLTIDLKNNKLIQQPLDESSGSINEKEFNDFCTQQLSSKA